MNTERTTLAQIFRCLAIAWDEGMITDSELSECENLLIVTFDLDERIML